jgi:hypothetical protein
MQEDSEELESQVRVESVTERCPCTLYNNYTADAFIEADSR